MNPFLTTLTQNKLDGSNDKKNSTTGRSFSLPCKTTPNDGSQTPSQTDRHTCNSKRKFVNNSRLTEAWRNIFLWYTSLRRQLYVTYFLSSAVLVQYRNNNPNWVKSHVGKASVVSSLWTNHKQIFFRNCTSHHEHVISPMAFPRVPSFPRHYFPNGVPPGSVVSPSLFNTFMHNLSTPTQPNTYIASAHTRITL